MKYCVDFSQKSAVLDKVDEINLRYDRREITFVDFLQEHKNQRINICIDDMTDFINESQMTRILAIHEKYPKLNIALRFLVYDESLDNAIAACKDNGIPFYFLEFIRNWDILNGYVSLGVSDVFIVEELGFELDAVYAITSKANVSIRVFPNVAQSGWDNTDALKKFFIRPEDIDLYGQYVDVCEFFGNTERINTTYEIYAKDKEWFGNLNELIISFNRKLDSRALVDIFSARRIKCGKKCMKGKPCNICDRAADLASTIRENGFILEHTKVAVDNE